MRLAQTSAMEPTEVEPGLFGLKLVDGSDGARQVSLVRGWMRPGARHSPHTHDVEEAVVFLAGTGVVEIDGRAYPVMPGSVVHIPPRAVHSTLNTGTEDLTFVAAFADNLIAANPLQTGARPRADTGITADVRYRIAWWLRRIAGRLTRR